MNTERVDPNVGGWSISNEAIMLVCSATKKIKRTRQENMMKYRKKYKDIKIVKSMSLGDLLTEIFHWILVEITLDETCPKSGERDIWYAFFFYY